MTVQPITFEQNPWLFPSSLYGNHTASHRWWRKTVKDVWKAKSWAIVDEKPKVDVRETTRDIVFDVSARGVFECHREPPHWFLSWVGDDRPYNIDTSSEEMRLADQELIKSGLKYLWYTIGHLGKHVQLRNLFENPRCEENSLALYRAIAVAIGHWLPELCFLSKRMTQSDWPTKPDFAYGDKIPPWLTALRFNFAWGGFRISKQPIAEEWQTHCLRHEGDPLEFLLILKMIEKDGDRYRPVAKRKSAGTR